MGFIGLSDTRNVKILGRDFTLHAVRKIDSEYLKKVKERMFTLI